MPGDDSSREVTCLYVDVVWVEIDLKTETESRRPSSFLRLQLPPDRTRSPNPPLPPFPSTRSRPRGSHPHMSSYSLSSSPANESKPSSSIATSSAAPPVLPLHHLRHLNQSMLSGAGAGLISSVVTCPLDVIKTRLQAQEIGRGKVGYEGVLGQSNVSSFLLLSFDAYACAFE